MSKKAERGVPADELDAARLEAQRRLTARADGAERVAPQRVRVAKFRQGIRTAMAQLDRAFPEPFADLRKQAYDGLLAAVFALNDLGRRERPSDDAAVTAPDRDLADLTLDEIAELEAAEVRQWVSRTHDSEDVTAALVLHERGFTLYESTRAVFALSSADCTDSAEFKQVQRAAAVKALTDEEAAEWDALIEEKECEEREREQRRDYGRRSPGRERP